MQPQASQGPLTVFCVCAGTPHTAHCRLLRHATRQLSLLTPPAGPQFCGETYEPKQDQARLGKQLVRVRDYMADGRWHSLREIGLAVRAPEASVSARLRDIRRPLTHRKPGLGLEVERRRVEGGLWQYRVKA